MLLGRAQNGDDHRFLGTVSVAAAGGVICQGQVDYMQTDSRTLLAQGVTLAQRTFTLASDAFDWTSDSLDHLVLHQVSAVHTRKLCETLGLDPDKAFLTFPNFGNIGPASLPYTLSKMVDGGLIQSGQRLGLMGIGSGLNCAMGEIVW